MNTNAPAAASPPRRHDIVVVGGGSAGISVAASLLARKSNLDIAIVEPAETHYYQPGWTMVGGGIFRPEVTSRPMASLIPRGAAWIKARVASFAPDDHAVMLDDGSALHYRKLIVAPGLTLNWNGIPGLVETLGRNGVTSNYRHDLAPYTWELVRGLKSGHAVFTQPPMPIKCAGAPQKAMYLSADQWRRDGRLSDIRIDFYASAPTLFGVAAYIPALMRYVESYGAGLNLQHTLTRIDGPAHTAWFNRVGPDGVVTEVETKFDMIHVVPPQHAPDFVRTSKLADAAGWVDVNPATLRHKTLPDIYALGDVANTTNAKTAAAARKQAPVVAHNVLKDLGTIQGAEAQYNGYGSCPLTVERGRIVLAEFGYGGKLLPTFPLWLIKGTEPRRLSWMLKASVLPWIYWNAMLKGKEWLAKPDFAG